MPTTHKNLGIIYFFLSIIYSSFLLPSFQPKFPQFDHVFISFPSHTPTHTLFPSPVSHTTLMSYNILSLTHYFPSFLSLSSTHTLLDASSSLSSFPPLTWLLIYISCSYFFSNNKLLGRRKKCDTVWEARTRLQ